jgi:hypothetical protein
MALNRIGRTDADLREQYRIDQAPDSIAMADRPRPRGMPFPAGRGAS